MLTKCSNFKVSLSKSWPSLYLLIGQEFFLLDLWANQIKRAWEDAYPEQTEITRLDIANDSDWSLLKTEVKSYSLFSSQSLLYLRYDKKTFDTEGKNFFNAYLQDPRHNFLLLMQAQNLTAKNLDWLIKHPKVETLQTQKPQAHQIKQWLQLELNTLSSSQPKEAVELIYQYNEGNLLGCAQALEKLRLIKEKDQALSLDDVKDQLISQCQYSLYDLSECCLKGDALKALALLKSERESKTEASLILWLLAQEIERLIECQSSKQGTELSQRLKIWPKLIPLYQTAARKFNQEELQDLLKTCVNIDKLIKSGQTKLSWQHLDSLSLALCKRS